MPWAVEVWSPNHWLPGNSSTYVYICHSHSLFSSHFCPIPPTPPGWGVVLEYFNILLFTVTLEIITQFLSF